MPDPNDMLLNPNPFQRNLPAERTKLKIPYRIQKTFTAGSKGDEYYVKRDLSQWQPETPEDGTTLINKFGANPGGGVSQFEIDKSGIKAKYNPDPNAMLGRGRGQPQMPRTKPPSKMNLTETALQAPAEIARGIVGIGEFAAKHPLAQGAADLAVGAAKGIAKAPKALMAGAEALPQIMMGEPGTMDRIIKERAQAELQAERAPAAPPATAFQRKPLPPEGPDDGRFDGPEQELPGQANLRELVDDELFQTGNSGRTFGEIALDIGKDIGVNPEEMQRSLLVAQKTDPQKFNEKIGAPANAGSSDDISRFLLLALAFGAPKALQIVMQERRDERLEAREIARGRLDEERHQLDIERGERDERKTALMERQAEELNRYRNERLSQTKRMDDIKARLQLLGRQNQAKALRIRPLLAELNAAAKLDSAQMVPYETFLKKPETQALINEMETILGEIE